jgi:hypothetical protein
MRIIYVIIFCLIVACKTSNDRLEIGQFETWLSDTDNGLYKTKTTSNVDVTARFLPANYLAYKEYRSSVNANYDSIVRAYQCGLTFEIELQADKTDKMYGNLLYYGVPDADALTQRTRYLNFNVSEFVTLTYGDQVYEPVLSNFEGYNSIGNKINFIVVFELPEYNCGSFKDDSQNELRLTFKDPYWDLGVNHFTFEKKYILTVPNLKY